MRLSLEQIKSGAFAGKGYLTPAFDVEAVRRKTSANPKWIHFGAGNILRAFPAALCQRLLDEGLTDTGIIVVECYDEEIIDAAFKPYDNLTVAVSLKKDASVDKQIIASITEAMGYSQNASRVAEIMTSPGLQMATMTITEKGYAVMDADKTPLKYCAGDFLSAEAPVSIIGKITKLLLDRYISCKAPLAMVSLDNCSHNGTILRDSVMAIAQSWQSLSVADAGFVDYLSNDISFTWSMIDKITPRPSMDVVKLLQDDGLEGVEINVTAKNTYVSAMVNAEECQYLAIEDDFPNGRPPLERAGVIFSDRESIDRIERMKVCTCLNPLHTCLAIFGCLLGYKRISDEMKDPALVALIKRIGYDEGLPVVTDPGIMSAKGFLDEVIRTRFPNPFVPDTPQRIACDTSKKLPVRFGETLKAYISRGEKDLGFLKYIPAVFAGYARYLTGTGDDGLHFEPSPDPNLDRLRGIVSDFALGEPFDASKLRPLFEDAEIFGVDLYKYGLGERAEALFSQMNGIGLIRATLDGLTK
ncbi:MAG: mannitol dehydrogenase family protein [Clostridia bacterium]|nr:mannitol dehydrogenase family protein [Clostridia bacterium]